MKPLGVKICGVTRIADAELAVELGADYIGLNFWSPSPRYLTLERARPIAEAVADRTTLVGVWVDPDRREVETLATELNLDLLQFHGERDPAAVTWFPRRVIKAIRLEGDTDGMDLEPFAQAWGFLFDCAPAGLYGGTGRSWSYERIAHLEFRQPVLVAGGLNPDNVAQAAQASRADIVDVCSGVEASPGVKDPRLLERFIHEVRDVESRD